MGMIPTKGITPYYIDLNRKEHREMKSLTIAFNRKYWIKKMNPFQRINLKTWYGGGACGSGKLKGYPYIFQSLHLLNTDFFSVPNIMNAQLEAYNHKKYMARRKSKQVNQHI